MFITLPFNPHQIIIGTANRYEWLFFVNPNNPDELMREEDGGVLMEEQPTTTAKFMKECRGLFGVMMKEDVNGNLVGHRMRPFNYTLKKVVGPVKYRKKFWQEVRRVQALKTTGTPRSAHWKDAGEGLEGGPYEAKYGDTWREMVKAKIGSGQDAVCNVVDLMAWSIAEGNRLFADTPFKDNWVIYHDALSSWWSKEAQAWMREQGFGDRQIRGLGHTNAGSRYEGTLPGDTPEYMPLDSNLFADLETAVRWNVAATRRLPRHHPDRFDLTTPSSAWSVVSRTWEHSPTPERIVQDIQRVFLAIDQVVEARGRAVDFVELRHGRRLMEQREQVRAERRSAQIRRKKKFGDVKGLHPVSRRCIADFFDLTLE